MQPGHHDVGQLLGLPKLQEPFIAKARSARTSPSRTQLGSRPSSSWVKATALLSEQVLPGRSQNPATNGDLGNHPQERMQAPAEAFRSVRRTPLPSAGRPHAASGWSPDRGCNLPGGWAAAPTPIARAARSTRSSSGPSQTAQRSGSNSTGCPALTPASPAAMGRSDPTGHNGPAWCPGKIPARYPRAVVGTGDLVRAAGAGQHLLQHLPKSPPMEKIRPWPQPGPGEIRWSVNPISIASPAIMLSHSLSH